MRLTAKPPIMPTTTPTPGKRQCLTDYPLKDSLTLRPECEARSDFLRLSLDGVGDNAIHADTHERETGSRKDNEQCQQEA
jgi:hypothetical protein